MSSRRFRLSGFVERSVSLQRCGSPILREVKPVWDSFTLLRGLLLYWRFIPSHYLPVRHTKILRKNRSRECSDWMPSEHCRERFFQKVPQYFNSFVTKYSTIIMSISQVSE